jgi:hypothetical protein
LLNNSQKMMKRMYLLLNNFTCDGVQVSSLSGCISPQGTLCSGVGNCTNNVCACESGRTGQYCQAFTSSSSDTTTILLGTLTLPPPAPHHIGRVDTNCLLGNAYTASIIPAVVGGLCLVGCLVALLIFVIKRSRDTTDDWEVNYEELEVGEQLGVGGYGAVHKAMWKGTEVAVKVMLADKITRDMEKGFKDEVPPKNHQVFPLSPKKGGVS